MTLSIAGNLLSRSASPNNRSAAMGMGCIGMFLLLFGGVGMFTALTGVQRILGGNLREGLVQMLVGLVFAGFAGAFVALLVVGRRKLKEQESLKARHPDQPWLWQTEWSSGRISDSSRGTLWLSWVFASFWNLISIPVGVVGVRAALLEGNNAGLVAVLFPLVGVGLLAWAIQTTLRYQKYGVSRLELSTIPGTIGRNIAGTVSASSPLQPADGFEVMLTCVRRVTTRSGDDSTTSESILWQEETRVRGEPSRDPAGLGTRIPVGFRIPSDVQPSDASNPRDQIVWRLKVSASVPGVDYQSVFEVPVFRTPASALAPTQDEAPIPEQVLDLEDFRQPPESRITVTRNRRGTEIHFPAARNPGVAIGSTVFTLLWTGIVAALLYSDAPVIFPVVFGLFELLLVYGTLQLWLGVSRVAAEKGMLVIAQGYFYPARERRIGANQIADVSVKIGMQAGSTPYYDVVIVGTDGKRVTAGRSVPNKREAEWLAFMIKNAVGLTTASRESGVRS